RRITGTAVPVPRKGRMPYITAALPRAVPRRAAPSAREPGAVPAASAANERDLPRGYPRHLQQAAEGSAVGRRVGLSAVLERSDGVAPEVSKADAKPGDCLPPISTSARVRASVA